MELVTTTIAPVATKWRMTTTMSVDDRA